MRSSDKEEATDDTPSKLHPKIYALVDYLYEEAKQALMKVVSARITSRGIETPLGVLTKEQIKKGESILDKILTELKKVPRQYCDDASSNLSLPIQTKQDPQLLRDLSGEYFTSIPERVGRSQEVNRCRMY